MDLKKDLKKVLKSYLNKFQKNHLKKDLKKGSKKGYKKDYKKEYETFNEYSKESLIYSNDIEFVNNYININPNTKYLLFFDFPIIYNKKWVGSPKNRDSSILYLLKKYKIYSTITRNYDMKNDNYIFKWYCNSRGKRKLEIPKNFNETIKEFYNNKKLRFFIIYTSLKSRYCVGDNHANMIIIDKKTNTAELFEPGEPKYGYDIEKLNIKLKDLFLHYNIKYVPTIEFCPIGPMRLYENIKTKPRNVCMVWTIWFTELKLLYPDIDRNTLIKNALNILKNEQFTASYINLYGQYLLSKF